MLVDLNPVTKRTDAIQSSVSQETPIDEQDPALTVDASLVFEAV